MLWNPVVWRPEVGGALGWRVTHIRTYKDRISKAFNLIMSVWRNSLLGGNSSETNVRHTTGFHCIGVIFRERERFGRNK